MRAPLLMLLAVLAALWLPSPGRALAEIIGDARVGFSAERILIIDGHNYVGKMWHMPGKQRHEQDLPAIRPIFILRSDSAFGDIVLPQLHTVVEFALPRSFRSSRALGFGGRLSERKASTALPRRNTR